jgi:hypothetical protein
MLCSLLGVLAHNTQPLNGKPEKSGDPASIRVIMNALGMITS